MKRKNLIAAGCFLLAGMQFPAFAVSFTAPDGLIYDINKSAGTAVFTGIDNDYVAQYTDLQIPATVESGGTEYDVVALGDRCCYSNRTIQSLEIGENVKSVGSYAFASCTQLLQVSFPEGLETLGSMSFYGCMMADVALPSSLRKIDDFAFFYAPLLSTVTIPASVLTIGAAPFGDCPSLMSIEVEEGNEYFTAVDGVLYNKNMTRLINYPIADGKTSFTVPETVRVIGTNSMRNNSVMTSVTLDDALQVIEAGAFNYCVLTSVHIPAGVVSIGDQAFSANASLAEFTVDPENKYFAAINGMLLTKDTKKLLVGISVKDVVIPEGVEEICESSFYRMPAVETLTLSPTVKTIGRSAFSTCSKLSEINFSTSLETIELQAFYSCTSLRRLELPSSLRRIESAAFAVCSGLQKVEISEGLESVAESVFQACQGLRIVYLPSTLSSVGEAMFYACTMLEKCMVPEGVETIGRSAFSSCLALKSLTLPSTLVSIEGYAFNSAGIKEIEFPDGLQSIGEGAFEFAQMESVILPASVVSVDSQCFSWNSNLKSFHAGSGLRELGSYALAKCDYLTDLELNEGLTYIGACAFHACESLVDLEIPSTVSSVGSMIFAVTPGLRNLTVRAMDPPATDGSFYNDGYVGYDVVKLNVPEASVDKYKAAPEWQNYNIIEVIPGSVNMVETDAPRVMEVYDINGHTMHAPVSGLNIYRMSDGSVRKVIRK